MRTWIALFRGINVGGANPLPMKGLVATLESLGFSDVRTYVQSGNAVFRDRSADASRVSQRIAKAVARDHGFTPRLVVLGLEDLQRAAKANPFPEAAGDPRTLHVFFLAEAPGKPDLARMDAIRARTESFSLKDKCLYVHAPDGFGTSKLAKGAERLLGVDATARNWRTVTALLDLASR